MGRKKKEVVIIDPYEQLSNEDRITMLIRDSKIRPTRLSSIFGEERFNQIMNKAAEIKAIKIRLVKPYCNSISVFPYRIEMYTVNDSNYPSHIMGEILNVNKMIEYAKKYDPYKGMADFWGIIYFLKNNLLYGFFPIGEGEEYKCCWKGEYERLKLTKEIDDKTIIIKYKGK